jgi:hypothetical protein
VVKQPLLILAVLALTAACTNSGPPGPLVSPTDPTRAQSGDSPTGVGMQVPDDD